MKWSELFLIPIVALGVGAFAVAVAPKSQTANVLKAGAEGFASIVRASTLQGANA